MKCYRLKYFDDSFCSDNYYKFCSNLKNDVSLSRVTYAFSKSNGEIVIDADKLQRLWFPTNEPFDCFISHSKKDEEIAKQIAAEIEKQSNCKCFIDSQVWNRYDKLEKALKDRFPSYDIDGIKTNVYMLLTEALFRVIANSKYFLFLETNNSIVKVYDEITYSPWLFFEMSVAKQIKDLSYVVEIEKRRGKRAALMESKNLLKMGFKSFVDEFEIITPNTIDDFYNSLAFEDIK